jgi:hypothetical protein
MGPPGLSETPPPGRLQVRRIILGLAVLALLGRLVLFVLQAGTFEGIANRIPQGLLLAIDIAIPLALLGTIVSYGGVRAVAKYTFAQCLRMKTAVAFMILLGAGLGTLPFVMKGDGTLAGQVRTFLSYGTSLTGLLLILVTVFVSPGMISFDVRDKQVFSVATKPLPRWQYIVGRWLGVVLLDVLLVAMAGAAIYGLAQYLRRQPAISPADRQNVENNVFVARQMVGPDIPNVEREIDQWIDRLRDPNYGARYEQELQRYRDQVGGDTVRALKLMRDQKRDELLLDRQSARGSDDPNVSGGMIVWTFSGIQLKASASRGVGRVLRTDGRALAKVQADPYLVANILPRGPVEVAGFPGLALEVQSDSFVVQFRRDDAERVAGAGLAAGKEVPVVVEPAVQILFKASPVGGASVDMLYSRWVAVNREKGYLYGEDRTDPARIATTILVPARAITSDGRLEVRYLYASPGKVAILYKDVALLYPVGGFEANFLRAMLLLLLPLPFMAAIGVFAGSFLSYPVACLTTFTALPFTMMRDFLGDALNVKGVPESDVGWFIWFGRGVYAAMRTVLPDLERVQASDWLVDGQHISWTFVGENGFWILGLSTSVALAVACLIFWRRELARVQV